LNYGGGLKWHFSRHVGFRMDVRGLFSRNPTFMLPNYPTGGLYIPSKEKLHGLQATAGLTFYIGKEAAPPPAPPPPAPPPPPRKLGDITGGAISGMDGLLCQGQAITLRSNASDPEGKTLSYKWKLNGRDAGTGPSLTFTPDRAGSSTVELEVSDSSDSNRVTKVGPFTMNIQEYRVPVASGCSSSPSGLNFGDGSALSVTGTGSPCSGTLRYKWSVTEGSVSGDTSPKARFDSKTVRFEPTARTQTKSVKVTAIITDDRGGSGSASTAIQVKFTPTSVRFSDLIFPKNNDRVNNCAKRVLLEEVVAKAADPDYDIYLVGHMAADEVSKTKKPSDIDRRRVLNAAAVLTGGSGTCANLDPSRIKVEWVGTDQNADKQPGLCGSSARPAAQERKTSQVTAADDDRRVEVWLVPKGTALPSSIRSPRNLDEFSSVLKKLGCPK